MSQNQLIWHIENERILIMERLFDAPREKVFKMFTDTEYLKEFWGPHGFELPHSKMDFREDGEWHYGMQSVDTSQETFGMVFWGKANYTEIVEPERIAYMDYFSDQTGRVDPDMPASKVTMDFMDLGNQTKLISKTELEDADALKSLLDTGMIGGITETWERLDKLLEKQST